jgi:hypothetical protein
LVPRSQLLMSVCVFTHALLQNVDPSDTGNYRRRGPAAVADRGPPNGSIRLRVPQHSCRTSIHRAAAVPARRARRRAVHAAAAAVRRWSSC